MRRLGIKDASRGREEKRREEKGREGKGYKNASKREEGACRFGRETRMSIYLSVSLSV